MANSGSSGTEISIQYATIIQIWHTATMLQVTTFSMVACVLINNVDWVVWILLSCSMILNTDHLYSNHEADVYFASHIGRYPGNRCRAIEMIGNVQSLQLRLT